MRVVLADKERVLREGLECVFARLGDVQVVGSFPDGRTLLDNAPALKPDVAVAAAHLPDGPGAEWLRLLCREVPGMRAIILTHSHAEADLVLALDAGVAAYICKESAIGDLVRAMRETDGACFHVSPCIATRLCERSQPHSNESLSAREVEVLFAMKDGLTTDEIGTRLMMSPGTVKSHLGSIYRKLNARNRVEALRHATELGVLDSS